MLVRGGSALKVKLLDFGIVKILEHDGDAPTLTATGVAVGTPHYMSPEQAKGSKVSIRADLYSLGCMIFELLSGRPPFDGSDFMSVLISHVRDPVPHLAPMTHWGEAIPEAVRHTVYESLSKLPQERAGDAPEMLNSLIGTPQSRPSGELGRKAVSTYIKELYRLRGRMLLAVGVSVILLFGWWLSV
jgi:serine/threonine protein kinase